MKTEAIKPMTLALYKSIQHGYTLALEYREGKAADEFVCISNPLQVQFEPLSDDAVIRGAIAALDAEERSARMQLERRLADIRERKSQLLALTFQPEAV